VGDREHEPLAGAGVDAVVCFCDAVKRQRFVDRDVKCSPLRQAGEVGCRLPLAASGTSSLPSRQMVRLANSIGQKSKAGRGSRVA
jgi:hypothetical protein